jgi:hypothetical protein
MAKTISLSSRVTGAFKLTAEHLEALKHLVNAGAEGICPEARSDQSASMVYLAHYRLAVRDAPGRGRSHFIATDWGKAVVLEHGAKA